MPHNTPAKKNLKSSSRIAFNTVATYGRSVLTLGLSLFSSRWVLNALGATDFGLFNVVGALIVFLAFFNVVMASSAARHFAYAIGKSDIDDVNKWFNTSLSIHLILPAILIAIGWPIAEYAVRNVLTIPPERIDACVIVFRISLIGAFVNMASIPLIAMFTAKQRLVEIAFWGLLQSVIILCFAWILNRVSSDRLLFYAAGMVGINVFFQVIQIVRAFWMFPECRLRLQSGFDPGRLKELFRFAVWATVGIFGTTLRDQGSTVLLNLHFGPLLNAAFGIARQVSAQVNQLSSAMMGALVPEITAREGRGERARMLQLSHQSCKYAFLLVLFFAAPLIVEMDYVLKLWLRNPPEHTAIFCRLIIGTFLISRLTAGYSVAVNALGKMAGFHSTVGGLLVLTLPLAWLFLRLGYPPGSLGVAFMIISTIQCIGCAYWIRVLFGEPVKHWVGKVLWPCLLVSGTSFIGALCPLLFMQESFKRVVLASIIGVTTASLTTWYFALNKGEHAFFQQAAKSAFIKFGRADVQENPVT
jgi:O-antigen/teichoic acid export membrane protein